VAYRDPSIYLETFFRQESMTVELKVNVT